MRVVHQFRFEAYSERGLDERLTTGFFGTTAESITDVTAWIVALRNLEQTLVEKFPTAGIDLSYGLDEGKIFAAGVENDCQVAEVLKLSLNGIQSLAQHSHLTDVLTAFPWLEDHNHCKLGSQEFWSRVYSGEGFARAEVRFAVFEELLSGNSYLGSVICDCDGALVLEGSQIVNPKS